MMRRILLKCSSQECLKWNHRDGFVLYQPPWSRTKFPRIPSSLRGRSGLTSRAICLGHRRQDGRRGHHALKVGVGTRHRGRGLSGSPVGVGPLPSPQHFQRPRPSPLCKFSFRRSSRPLCGEESSPSHKSPLLVQVWRQVGAQTSLLSRVGPYSADSHPASPPSPPHFPTLPS